METAIWTEDGPAPRFSVLSRHIRTSRRLSQNALALASTLSPSTVRGWEAGRSEPSMPELTRWCRALDLSGTMTAAVRSTLIAPRAWADRPGIGIGPYLRERRLASGTTLSRAAAELGLPLATLGHYESGRVEVPSGILSSMVERFAVGAVERAALCDGAAAFLEWCDSLVATREKVEEALSKTVYAVTPLEILDRGPAFIRLRTGLLRACLRGGPWHAYGVRTAAHHALWLAVGDRRIEASAALSDDERGVEAIGAITRRYLGRVHAEELRTLAEGSEDPAVAAWLLAEAALDLVERRRGAEARTLIARAISIVDDAGRATESWMRRRDAVRIALRLREWKSAETELDELARSLPVAQSEDDWYTRQILVLRARLLSNESTARPA